MAARSLRLVSSRGAAQKSGLARFGHYSGGRRWLTEKSGPRVSVAAARTSDEEDQVKSQFSRFPSSSSANLNSSSSNFNVFANSGASRQSYNTQNEFKRYANARTDLPRSTGHYRGQQDESRSDNSRTRGGYVSQQQNNQRANEKGGYLGQRGNDKGRGGPVYGADQQRQGKQNGRNNKWKKMDSTQDIEIVADVMDDDGAIDKERQAALNKFGKKKSKGKPKFAKGTTTGQESQRNQSSSLSYKEMKRLRRKPKKKQVQRVMPVVALPANITIRELALRGNMKSLEIIDCLINMGAMDDNNIKVISTGLYKKLLIHARSRSGRLSTRQVSEAAESIVVNAETAELLMLEFGIETKREQEKVEDEIRTDHELAILEDMPGLVDRPPIVTVMGHVDHGKTTLLDKLRNAKVADSEDGGITQSVGAFQFVLEDQAITFLDTPGHEAFTSMRKCGSLLTDLVVLVVAATDGVRNQTIESIELAKAAQVPIIVALSKIDVDGIDVEEASERISAQLEKHDVLTERKGGSVQIVPIAAPSGLGLTDLSEAIILQASDMNLKASASSRGEAIILESRVDKGFGSLADVVLRWGTLRTGDHVVCGEQEGRIRKMLDTVTGKPIKVAPPSMPVRLSLGFKEPPSPGTDMLVVKNAKRAREVVELRARRREMTESEVAQREHLEEQVKEKALQAKEKELRALEKRLAWEKREARRQGLPVPREHAAKEAEIAAARAAALEQTKSGQVVEAGIKVPVILKADTDGSMEALRYSVDAMTADLQTKTELAGLSGGGEFQIIKRGIGEVTVSDVDMAKAFSASIFAFNVRAPPKVTTLADRNKVTIATQSVIYHLLDDLKQLARQHSPTERVAVVLGSAKVLQVFKMQPRKRSEGTWTVAGCRVQSGKINKKSRFRIVRDGEIIFAGGLDSLRIFKDDVNVVDEGKECGISFSSFQDFETNDVIEAFEMNEQVIE